MRCKVSLLIGVLLFTASCGDQPPDAANTSADNIEATAENATDSDNAAVPAQGDTVLCEEVGERVSRSDCDDIKAMRDRVRDGAAALNVPDPMVRGRAYAVSLSIDLRDLAEVEQIDAEQLHGTAAVPVLQRERLVLGLRMRPTHLEHGGSAARRRGQFSSHGAGTASSSEDVA